jgi:hypothetical protein
MSRQNPSQHPPHRIPSRCGLSTLGLIGLVAIGGLCILGAGITLAASLVPEIGNRFGREGLFWVALITAMPLLVGTLLLAARFARRRTTRS